MEDRRLFGALNPPLMVNVLMLIRVILVKDVSGVKSGDSKKVENSNTIKNLDTRETQLMLLVVDNPQLNPFNVVHELITKKGLGKSATCYDNLSLIFIKGRDFVRTSGIISKITEPLTENEITVFYQPQSSIKILVHSKEREKALKLIKKSFNVS